MKISILPFFVSFVIAFFCTGTFSQVRWIKDLKSQEWLGEISSIELLRATRIDVEKILGQPEQLGFKGADFIQYYTTAHGRITVSFTTSECTLKNGRRIPIDVVEELGLQPLNKIKFSSLAIPRSKFDRSVDEDAPSVETYSNASEGLEIEVQRDRVTEITFMPAKRLGLRCGDR